MLVVGLRFLLRLSALCVLQIALRHAARMNFRPLGTPWYTCAALLEPFANLAAELTFFSPFVRSLRSRCRLPLGILEEGKCFWRDERHLFEQGGCCKRQFLSLSRLFLLESTRIKQRAGADSSNILYSKNAVL